MSLTVTTQNKMPPTQTTKLYVGNLPETCRRTELEKLFIQYGSVVECDIVRNYGFVVGCLIVKQRFLVCKNAYKMFVKKFQNKTAIKHF